MPGHSFVFLLLVLALPATAQISESIEVHLLEIEATVVDRSGKPVEGLTAADFDVRVEGKRVPVTNRQCLRRGKLPAVRDRRDELREVMRRVAGCQ